MPCPICDQKPMNCDCTETERRQHQEIEELRLTAEEREAIEAADAYMSAAGCHNTNVQKTLRGLLERLGGER